MWSPIFLPREENKDYNETLQPKGFEMDNSSSTAVGALIGAGIALGVAAIVNHVKQKEVDHLTEVAATELLNRGYTQGYYEGRESVVAPWIRERDEETTKIPTQK